jgi:hypothetical protein
MVMQALEDPTDHRSKFTCRADIFLNRFHVMILYKVKVFYDFIFVDIVMTHFIFGVEFVEHSVFYFQNP